MSWRVFFATVALMPLLSKCEQACNPEPVPDSPITECWNPAELRDGPASACRGGNEIVEPNDRPSEATRVAPATCEYQRFAGSASTTDPDFFRSTGKKCGALTARLDYDGGATLEICIFASCTRGKTGISKCEGYEDGGGTHVPGGMVGCCHKGKGEMHVDATCDAELQRVALLPVEMDAFIAVRAVDGPDTCTPYSVDYHF